MSLRILNAGRKIVEFDSVMEEAKKLVEDQRKIMDNFVNKEWTKKFPKYFCYRHFDGYKVLDYEEEMLIIIKYYIERGEDVRQHETFTVVLDKLNKKK